MFYFNVDKETSASGGLPSPDPLLMPQSSRQIDAYDNHEQIKYTRM